MTSVKVGRCSRPPSRSSSGTLASLAVARHSFFGRETISFLVILPIALPGIVTGIALNSTFTQVLGIDLSLFTIVVGHATFCIVVVYNNVVARLRRMSGSFEEASADLGADPVADLPPGHAAEHADRARRRALLAFALSFDEIIVTTFTVGAGEQTLPIWIFTNFSRPNQLPIVNVVALLVILISIIPVYLAHRLTRDEGGRRPAAAEARRRSRPRRRLCRSYPQPAARGSERSRNTASPPGPQSIEKSLSPSRASITSRPSPPKKWSRPGWPKMLLGPLSPTSTSQSNEPSRSSLERARATGRQPGTE